MHETNEIARYSPPFSHAYFKSSRSKSLTYGIFNLTPGTLILLRFPKTPPANILQVTPSSSTDSTTNLILAFSSKIVSPTFNDEIASGWLVENFSSVPRTSSLTIRIVLPSTNSILSFSNIPLLNSGPLVSQRIATFIPVLFLTSRTDEIASFLSSNVA